MAKVNIVGPAGRLEARYDHSEQDNAPLALVLHPHPQHGGTMHNKVVYSMYHTFRRNGFAVMRFNFRGVGLSEGIFDKGEGELSDAAAALDWMQQHNKAPRAIWVGGFSFGAMIAMQLLMRRPEIDRFAIVAPPANMYDFSFLAPCPSSGVVIQGTADDIVPPDSVSKMVQRLQMQRGITITEKHIEGAGHFFDSEQGHMGRLMAALHRYVDQEMPLIAEEHAE